MTKSGNAQRRRFAVALLTAAFLTLLAVILLILFSPVHWAFYVILACLAGVKFGLAIGLFRDVWSW